MYGVTRVGTIKLKDLRDAYRTAEDIHASPGLARS